MMIKNLVKQIQPYLLLGTLVGLIAKVAVDYHEYGELQVRVGQLEESVVKLQVEAIKHGWDIEIKPAARIRVNRPAASAGPSAPILRTPERVPVTPQKLIPEKVP